MKRKKNFTIVFYHMIPDVSPIHYTITRKSVKFVHCIAIYLLYYIILYYITLHYITLLYYIFISTGDNADIDECAVNNGGCDPLATCTNTKGAFKCTCSPGYNGVFNRYAFTCTGKLLFTVECRELWCHPNSCYCGSSIIRTRPFWRNLSSSLYDRTYPDEWFL